ncbi:CoA transferase [bacterium]|nr:CoA transferase [bacterium]
MFANLTILDLSSVLAGPSVSMFFAELGAKIIKVENPQTNGDVTRSWKLSTEPKETNISAYFSSVNWGKLSISINLENKKGKEIVYDLARKSDILISSYKPDDDKKLKMDYETISEINPKIIYGHVTGFGKNDYRVGYDAILQAATGFMFMNGEQKSKPTKMPVALIDVLAAHQLKEGILLALIQKMKTGKGSYVTTSLLKSGIASLINQASNYLVGNQIPQRQGSEHPNIVPYGTVFTTLDKKNIVLAIGSEKQFTLLCKVLGKPELVQNPVFSCNQERVKNRTKVNQTLARLIKKFERSALIELLEKNKIPVSPIFDVKEVFEQKGANEMVLQSEQLKGVRSLAFESEFLNFEQKLLSPPELNENAEEILSEFLCYPTTKIEKLRSEKIVGF